MRATISQRCSVLVFLLSATCLAQSLAVELEPIQVRSRVGEPLLAEIRIRDLPANLQELSVGLPEPVVFARIGLPRPRGSIANLRFNVRQGDRGDAMIRITTPQPVMEDFLTFLVEVQWREGSLVREFSVALPAADTPTASPAIMEGAPLAPAPAPALPAPPPDPADVDAVGPAPGSAAEPGDTARAEAEPSPIPVVARSRPPPSTVPPGPEAAAIPVIPRASTGTTPAMLTGPTPVSRSPAAAPLASSVSSSATTPVTDAVAAAGSHIDVRRGSNLTGIARATAGDAPLDTALVAFLLANPDAFADGNINRLKHGETLRVPSADMLAAIDPLQASTLVALQASDWQDGTDASRQQAMASLLAEIETGLATTPMAVAPIAVVPAQMKIVPVEDAAGSTVNDRAAQLAPGLESETLATRDAEIRHLRKQIAELERANDEQHALIAMQNEALTQAQRHLDGGTSMFGLVRWPWLVVAALITSLALLAWKHSWQRPRRGAARVGAGTWRRRASNARQTSR